MAFGVLQAVSGLILFQKVLLQRLWYARSLPGTAVGSDGPAGDSEGEPCCFGQARAMACKCSDGRASRFGTRQILWVGIVGPEGGV